MAGTPLTPARCLTNDQSDYKMAGYGFAEVAHALDELGQVHFYFSRDNTVMQVAQPSFWIFGQSTPIDGNFHAQHSSDGHLSIHQLMENLNH